MRQPTARLTFLMALIAISLWPGAAHAQPRDPAPPSGVVFVGGYFYDPAAGPYPWWPLSAYSFAYYPIDRERSLVRLLVTPKQAAVYVDGFYAGLVADFDSIRPLPLPPGAHDIVLYLEGYRTIQTRAYLAPGSTVHLAEVMECLPVGERSALPAVTPLFPPPPAGTFAPPRTPRPAWPPPPSPMSGPAETIG